MTGRRVTALHVVTRRCVERHGTVEAAVDRVLELLRHRALAITVDRGHLHDFDLEFELRVSPLGRGLEPAEGAR